MTPKEFPQLVDALCNVCRLFGDRGWCRATSGNFSARIDDARFLITQSGRDKSLLSADDLMVCDCGGGALDPTCKPSAETPLHARLYALEPSIGAVLHTHSVAATTLSRNAGAALTVSGYEMQKAIRGVTTHETALTLPIFENDQDLDALAERIASLHAESGFPVPGFLIAGHGLYAWGRDVAEARRHVEGFEFLLDCAWQEMLASLP